MTMNVIGITLTHKFIRLMYILINSINKCFYCHQIRDLVSNPMCTKTQFVSSFDNNNNHHETNSIKVILRIGLF